ncbi:hypothetical protein M9458_055967 [Cirrhinus mrigala]|uniref:ribonuclease H n=1 Tax=Cirrhinus mrigala TaxID=683832 RepID=A0ABD0MG57_CIRMR
MASHSNQSYLWPLRQRPGRPSVSEWVMGIIKRGYSLQFARRPPRFSGVVPTLVVSKYTHVLRSEVMILLEKGAVEVVHPAQSESGFYSRYFLVPKKGGGLRPILDLRHLNRALMKRPFKMITLKQILSHIRPGDWFFSLDLKDAYFHIQIAPHHRRFFRFAFEGVAYQYTVLPFGLSLAPRTFTKCMDAALSLLRQRGIRILNYLDDWLVLAQSEAELLSHEPLSSSDLQPLTFKAAPLLALASVKHMGDLQALSVSPSCLEFGPGNSKVILKPRHGYVPQVPSTPFRAQVITLSALPSSEEDQELNLLCPVRALRMYIERSASFRQSEQLFVCFGGRNKGHPITKQRLSRWIVDAIMLAYSSLGLQCPVRVRAHSTRGMTSSWAWSSGVSIAEICAAASWTSPSTFTRFYNLDVPALQARVLSA